MSWQLRRAITVKESRVRRPPAIKTVEPLTFKNSGRGWLVKKTEKSASGIDWF